MSKIVSKKIKIIKKLYDLNEKKGLFWDYSPVTVLGILTRNVTYENAKNLREIWMKDNEWKRHPLFFYINFPFCVSKCNYCQYSKIEIKDVDTSRYIDNLIKNMEYFKKIFKDAHFSSLYVGGGTPSLMAKNNIDALFGYISKNFSFIDNAQLTFEANPTSLTEKKILLLKKYKFNRISLGIQSMDKDVLKSEGRLYMDFEKIKKISKFILNENLILNHDLIIGLKKDTPEKFFDSFKKLISLMPHSITLYKLRPTRKYSAEFESADLLYNQHHHILESVFEKLERLRKEKGYERFSGPESTDGFIYVKKEYFEKLNKVRPPETFFFDTQSTFAIGKFSVSNIGYSINYRDNSDFVFDPDKDWYEVFENDSSFAALRYIIDIINRNYPLDLDKFKECFNSEISDKYGEEIEYLRKRNKLTIEGRKINFSFNSLKEKFFYMLTFLDEEQLLGLFSIKK